MRQKQKKCLCVLTLVLHNITLNRKRSFYAVMGIVVGVAAVTTLASLGYSSQRALAHELKKLGTNMLAIEAVRSPQNRSRQERVVTALTESDITTLQDRVDDIAAVAPVSLQPGEVKNNDNMMNTDIFATRAAFMQISGIETSGGRFFSDRDDIEARKVILLGQTVVVRLFNDTDPVGKTVKLNNIDFEVIGVLIGKGLDASGEDQDDMVIIPLTTARQQPGIQDHITHIYIEVAKAEIIPAVKESIIQVLRAARQLEVSEPDYFNVLDQAQLLAARTDILGSVDDLVNILAVMTLLAGALGITTVQLI